MLKVAVAFCIGLGVLYGAQHMWLKYVLAEIATTPPVSLASQVKYEPIKTIDPEVMKKATGIVGPIDTSAGQRAAIESAARRVDLMNRAAANAVPLPPRPIAGLPR